MTQEAFPPVPPDDGQSVFARFAWKFLELGISVVPIAPGSKKPGQWSKEHGWRGMSDWTRFAERVPTDVELEHWEKWPDAGIGVVLGKQSKITGLDRDYEFAGQDALDAIIPWSPVAKKGEKGWTKFYLYNGEKSCSFDVGGARVLDILSDGRQTVVPPTQHPSGCHYVWISEQSLTDLLSVNELPKLPDDFIQQVERVLAPFQNDQDRQYQKRAQPPKESSERINTDLSIQAEYFRDLNRRALECLSDWVPVLVPTAKPNGNGYRCIATWRNVKNPNVGIDPTGIRDWGGNYGMTPIDLVMYANGLTFQKAAEALRAALKWAEPEPIVLSSMTAPRPATAPVLPWLKPAAAVAPPPVVMLPPETSIEPAPAIPSFIANPPGVLADIARWITATAPKAQPELSVAAAVALASVVMGRCYRTQLANYTSLYLVMVAKSGEGKEHPQACVQKILVDAGLPTLYAGSGYTSAGGVHSALLKAPAHIVAIDEMGKLLKLSRKNGQAHSEAAIDKLVEAFGRCDGVMHPPVYSSMTLSKSVTSQTERVVHNPAITLLGATTPGTFYEGLSTDLVKDGFLGRCIVVESKQPRQLTQLVERTQPPDHIIDWCKRVHVSGAIQGDLAGALSAEQPAQTIELPLDEACLAEYRRCERELNDAKDAAEGDGLDMLLVRTLEKAARLSAIVAKARNMHARSISLDDFLWAYQYVSYYDLALVRSVVNERTENEHDANMKRLLGFVHGARKYGRDRRFAAAAAAGGMPRNKLQALMKGLNSRQVNDLVETAIEAGFITRSPGIPFGMACDVYFPAGEVE